jgi:hypothetical protein
MNVPRSLVLLVLSSATLVPFGASGAAVVKTDLAPYRAKVGRLFRPGPPVRIAFRDESPPDPLVAWGVGGPGTLMAFYPESAAALQAVLEAAPREAAAVLGVANGAGGEAGASLEVVLKERRVDLAWGAFGSVNYIGYALVETLFRKAAGEEPERMLHRAAVYETWSGQPKNVLPRILSRPIWEATATALQRALRPQPDPEAVSRLVAETGTSKEDEVRGDMVFWLGWAGGQDPAVAEALFALFRTAKAQALYENAAVALARLGAPGAREEFRSVLDGTKKLKEWDPGDDAEEAWHLLRALSLLGEKELGAKTPAVKRYREKLADLVAFLEAGTVPRTGGKDAETLQGARDKAAKKMAK